MFVQQNGLVNKTCIHLEPINIVNTQHLTPAWLAVSRCQVVSLSTGTQTTGAAGYTQIQTKFFGATFNLVSISAKSHKTHVHLVCRFTLTSSYTVSLLYGQYSELLHSFLQITQYSSIRQGRPLGYRLLGYQPLRYMLLIDLVSSKPQWQERGSHVNGLRCMWFRLQSTAVAGDRESHNGTRMYVV